MTEKLENWSQIYTANCKLWSLKQNSQGKSESGKTGLMHIGEGHANPVPYKNCVLLQTKVNAMFVFIHI